MPHLLWQINGSKWATRGWTFQEAFLSRRRLVFTHHQAYFECGSMNCSENPRVDLHLMDREMKNNQISFKYFGRFSVADVINEADKQPQISRASMVSAQHLISNFTGRSLTFEGDAIKAFAGILRKWSAQTPPILHIWGLPILPFWYHAPGSSANLFGVQHLDQSLLWRHQARAHRRQNFPSWSWAGWQGQVSFPKHQPRQFFWTEMILEDYKGATQRIESWFGHTKGDKFLFVLSYPHALWLESFVISPKALRFDVSSGTTTKRIQTSWLGHTLKEHHCQFLFVDFGKHFIYQSHFMEGDDIRVPWVFVCLSDPIHFAFDMPSLLKIEKLELFVLSSTQSSVRGLVIDNSLGSPARIGTWKADRPCSNVLFDLKKLVDGEISSDWVIKRKMRLT